MKRFRRYSPAVLRILARKDVRLITLGELISIAPNVSAVRDMLELCPLFDLGALKKAYRQIRGG